MTAPSRCDSYSRCRTPCQSPVRPMLMAWAIVSHQLAYKPILLLILPLIFHTS